VLVTGTGTVMKHGATPRSTGTLGMPVPISSHDLRPGLAGWEL